MNASPVVAIMQPYFLPCIGYFQLIAAADMFVVHDTIQYTKKGWINRNRMLANGGDATFSLPLRHAPSHLAVVQRELAGGADGQRWLARLKGAYRHATHYRGTLPLLDRIAGCPDTNLFRFLLHALEATCAHLAIATPLRVSSTIPADHGVKGQDRVLALCRTLGARTYLNSIGGMGLYAQHDFAERRIDLRFLRARSCVYPQFGDAPFVPWLSIVDVLMFNPLATVQAWVAGEYDLVVP